MKQQKCCGVFTRHDRHKKWCDRTDPFRGMRIVGANQFFPTPGERRRLQRIQREPHDFMTELEAENNE